MERGILSRGGLSYFSCANACRKLGYIVRKRPVAVEKPAANFGRNTLNSRLDLPQCNTPLSTHSGLSAPHYLVFDSTDRSGSDRNGR
jgi:hypothetical protein